MGDEYSIGLMGQPLINHKTIGYTPIKYHSSWDWLVPVVKKILDLNNMEDLYKRMTRITESLIYLDITLLFEEVVSFITWYNQQGKQ